MKQNLIIVSAGSGIAWYSLSPMLRIPTHHVPTHPGEMLREEFLLPLEMTAQELAKRIHVPLPVIGDLIEERRASTPDLALRLSRLFGTTAEFWLNGQLAWDLYHAVQAPEAADIPDIDPLPLISSDDS